MRKASSSARAGKTRAQRRAPARVEDRLEVRTALWVSLALFATILVVFGGVRHFGFVNWDDPQYVAENPHVLGGVSWENVRWAFSSTRAAGLWLPITWLSLMLDATWWGSSPAGYHVTNVLLHAANAVLLFGLLYRTSGARGRSVLVAALFAFHPLQVESVAWVTERKDVLSTFFLLLTLWAYVGYANRPTLLRYLVTVVMYLLGLMTKPMLVTLPFLLLLLDVWPLARFSLTVTANNRSVAAEGRSQRAGARRLVLEKVPLFLMAVFASVITFAAQRSAGAMSTLDALPIDRRVPVALTSYVAYIGKLLWPSKLAGFYPYDMPSPTLVIGCALALLAITVFALLAARRSPYVPVGWFWYLGSLFPVIGLVQVGMQMRADRFTYVPAIGLFIIVAWGAYDLAEGWPRAKIALTGAGFAAASAYAIAARVQAGYWKDSVTFWQHALEVTHDNARAHANLGMALADLGRKDEATTHYIEAIRIEPELADAHVNLANVLASRGNTADAIAHYRDALRFRPNNVNAHNGLASALDDQGEYDAAIVQYREALSIEPGSATLVNNLGAALMHQGKLNEALPYLLEASRLAPEDPDYHFNAAALLEELGRFAEAGRQAEEALRRRPDHAQARTLLERLRVSGRVAPAPQ